MKIKVPLFIARLAWPKAQVLTVDAYGRLRRCTVRKGPSGWEFTTCGRLGVLAEGGDVRGCTGYETWEPYSGEIKELVRLFSGVTWTASIQRFERGLTVRELKEHIQGWPETGADGEPLEVWLGKGGVTNQAMELGPLNLRVAGDGTRRADLLIECN